MNVIDIHLKLLHHRFDLKGVKMLLHFYSSNASMHAFGFECGHFIFLNTVTCISVSVAQVYGSGNGISAWSLEIMLQPLKHPEMTQWSFVKTSG